MTKEEFKKKIPNELYELARLFPKNSPLYIVGGFIRDAIAFNKYSTDIDIASSIKPEELEILLENSKFKVFEASKRLGTMIIHGERGYEYTTFRIDSYPINDGVHSPTNVDFTNDIFLDAKRRDFKCNAIYYDILKDEIIDPLNGILDIKSKILSCVIDPNITLSQDGLRIMRLIRMVSNMGYTIENKTFLAAKKLVSRLQDISVERIQIELLKILDGDYCYEALLYAKDLGVINIIIPQLMKGDGVSQNKKYHKYDVLEHTFQTVKYSPKHIRLAALLHDIAKPYCLEKDNNMYKHDIVGAKMALDILKHYKFSNEIIEHTTVLIEKHMFNATHTAKINKIRKFIINNSKYIEDIIELQIADAKACGGVTEIIDNELKIQLQYMRTNNIPIKLNQLKINGNDLLKLGYKGNQVGQMLNELLFKCSQEEILNNRENLLNYANKRATKIIKIDNL